MLPSYISEALPQTEGFLRNYVDYASTCSDAPEIYHVGVALTVLAGTVGHKVSCPWLAGRRLLPNLYTLLVGPSRSSRKTASMDAGIEVAHLAQPSLVIPIPGSYEELVAQIRRSPQGLLTYREFGHFLKTTQHGYGEPIRTVLMDLFDWPSDRLYTRNLKKGATVIEPPICLSMLAGIATDLLFAYTDTAEWQGGFFGRMLVLYGERTVFRAPMNWPGKLMHLADQLRWWTQVTIPPCAGFAPDAWAMFEEWARWRDGETAHVPARVQTFLSSAMTLAAKIALLYAVDGGDATGGGWTISLEAVKRAVWFVEILYLPSVMHLGERLALGPWERDRQRVLDILDAAPLGIARRDLLRRAKMSSEYMDTIVSTLKEEATIVQGQDTRGITYRRASEDAASGAPAGQLLQFARAAGAVID